MSSRLAVRNTISPPPGMASRALNTRFRITRMICSGSALTLARSPLKAVTRLMCSPMIGRSSFSTSATTELRVDDPGLSCLVAREIQNLCRHGRAARGGLADLFQLRKRGILRAQATQQHLAVA